MTEAEGTGRFTRPDNDAKPSLKFQLTHSKMTKLELVCKKEDVPKIANIITDMSYYLISITNRRLSSIIYCLVSWPLVLHFYFFILIFSARLPNSKKNYSSVFYAYYLQVFLEPSWPITAVR